MVLGIKSSQPSFFSNHTPRSWHQYKVTSSFNCLKCSFEVTRNTLTEIDKPWNVSYHKLLKSCLICERDNPRRNPSSLI